MSDYNEELSELHQFVVSEGLGLPATIDEDGWIQFTHPGLGDVETVLREYNPEYMMVQCRFFSDDGRQKDDLIRVCNRVNNGEFAKLWVSDAGAVRVGVGLFVAAPETPMTIKGKLLPDEDLLRGVYLLAMSAMLRAVKEFTAELEKVE
ncbi:MAG: hypothetical protein QOI24_1235 [Acidobacteriota bacterium]|jgi:hypothetical protein|nr:hypothetical protein [Acidobacteriota bacterium]